MCLVIPECNAWLVAELVFRCERVSSFDSVNILVEVSGISTCTGCSASVSLKSSNRLCAGNSTVMDRAPFKKPQGLPWSNNTVNKTRSGSTTAQALRLIVDALVIETSVFKVSIFWSCSMSTLDPTAGACPDSLFYTGGTSMDSLNQRRCAWVLLC